MKTLGLLLLALIATTCGTMFFDGMLKSAFQIGFFVVIGVSLLLLATDTFG